MVPLIRSSVRPSLPASVYHVLTVRIVAQDSPSATGLLIGLGHVQSEQEVQPEDTRQDWAVTNQPIQKAGLWLIRPAG